ncbi:MAG: single-stranded-DNA-specific exonuclease RecJ [Acidobacteria bacterium]|nr:single-stranded-DNA-specific exonuclease RecJ [Acidobacteriota bacterium]
MVRKIWDDVPSDAAGVSHLAAALGVPEVVARLLHQRGFTDPDAAQRFLDPRLSHLHDPFLLTDMRPAVDRLRAAIAARERVVIHGDYDADGITSTAMLYRALEMQGADVGHFVPDRMRDGYGLQPDTVEQLAAQGARLIVSVDCGIRASEAARRARSLGVDLIITDHHEPEAELPQAVAVINPKRPDCAYPEKYLAGAGVALKLVQALLQESEANPEVLSSFIKMAAIGTLADVVPLVGENRVIAKFGLQGLSRGPHGTGLEALLEESGLVGKQLDSFHVGFVLAPRLNAAGRMSHAGRAVDLLLARGRDAQSRTAARALAKELTEENARRQDSEAGMLIEAKRMVEKDPEIGGPNLIIVASEGWHRGVVGIVASKLVDGFCKPAIVLSIENGVAHGSCRSIPAFDMLGALEANADLFLKFGGHKQAAGVTVDAARLPELRRRLTEYANAHLNPGDLIPRLRIDAPLGLREITGGVVEALMRLGPFGAANPKPIFRASPVELAQPPRVLKERHLALMFRQDGRSFRGIAWRAAEREAYLTANRFGLELAYSLDQNEFRGETTTELTVADVRAPEGDR